MTDKKRWPFIIEIEYPKTEAGIGLTTQDVLYEDKNVHEIRITTEKTLRALHAETTRMIRELGAIQDDDLPLFSLNDVIEANMIMEPTVWNQLRLLQINKLNKIKSGI